MARCRSRRKWGVSCGRARWWQGVDWGAENEGWAVSAGEERNAGVDGDVTGDRSVSERLDFGWNFSFWFQMKEAEVAKVMSLVGSVDEMWSKVGNHLRKELWCR